MNTIRRPAIESAGERFGRLVVTAIFPGKKGAVAKAKCDCGGEWEGPLNSLRKKTTKSCGCMARKKTNNGIKTHGMSKSPEFKIWAAIKTRCFNENTHSYKNYGGRGITLFDPWVNDFQAFYAYVGPRPSNNHSIERSDNSAGYVPGNVSWQTKKVQANNNRRNHLVTIDGVTKNMMQWCALYNRRYHTVYERITKCGWDVKSALTTPTARPYVEVGACEETDS